MGIVTIKSIGLFVYYFDHNASTPLAPEVLAAMERAQRELFGNPSSIHAAGQAARKAVEAARAQVAGLLRCDPKEVIFTSGGTEADNLAIFGVAGHGPDGHVVTTALEHPAVLEPVRARGNFTVIPVGSDGVVDPDEIRRALRPDTVLISVMHANNETGAIQPLGEIAAIAREAGVPLHSDGVQAATKITTDVGELGVDLYSITGHKFNGPKGAGALYVRDGVKLSSLQMGGRHERNHRAGTENVAAIVGLGEAASLQRKDVAPLRDRLEAGLLARVPDAVVNTASAARTPNTSSMRFPGLDSEALLIALDLAGFAVSAGAACSSGAVKPSHVLTAMGLSMAEARSSIRFSVGLGNTEEQVDLLIAAVEAASARLRKLAPAGGLVNLLP
ncbi:MAG: cysteine desulfurase [Acidobacteria bacterium]|nr:cysteine desulfurase [Acidobacteriota bacterium]